MTEMLSSESWLEANSVAIWLPGVVQVGFCVSEVQQAFVTTPATVYAER